MNEVVIGAPYSVTKDLMNHFKVDVVCHGQTELPLDNGTQDPYAVPKTMGKFISVDSGTIFSNFVVVSRHTLICIATGYSITPIL